MSLVLLANYIDEVLNFDSVIIGRENAQLTGSYNQDKIVLDTVSIDQVGKSRDYEVEKDSSGAYIKEELTRLSKHKSLVTVEFFGLNGEDNAYKLLNSFEFEKAYDFQRDNQISIYYPTNVRRSMFSIGGEFYPKYELLFYYEFYSSYSQNIKSVKTFILEKFLAKN